MTLVEAVQKDLVQALKNKDKVTVSALRGFKSAFQKASIEKKGELDEAAILQVLKKEIKQRQDSFDTYKKAGRNDLADNEMAEIKVLQNYQPAQLSEEEVSEAIKKIIATVETKDFGPLMGIVMKELQGQADGKVVQAQLKSILSNQDS